MTYSFWFATGGAGCYIAIPHTFTLVSKYILFWHNFRSGIWSNCVPGGRRRAFFLLLLILIFFSRRACIISPLGKQWHLVLRFWTIIWPSCWKCRAVCICLIFWCYVTVWPSVRQHAPSLVIVSSLLYAIFFIFSVAKVDRDSCRCQLEWYHVYSSEGVS